jgi:hypothetical protein
MNAYSKMMLQASRGPDLSRLLTSSAREPSLAWDVAGTKAPALMDHIGPGPSLGAARQRAPMAALSRPALLRRTASMDGSLGRGLQLALPKKVREAAAILRHCNAAGSGADFGRRGH